LHPNIKTPPSLLHSVCGKKGWCGASAQRY
jgi:hypothetical protein